MDADVEFLRSLFADRRLHNGIGVVTQLAVGLDKSTLRAVVDLLPEHREVVCIVAWETVTDIEFPRVNDLVLVAMVDGHPDESHITRNLTSSDDPIPDFAIAGHKVIYSRSGAKAYLGSDTKVSIGRPGVEGTENLVLGQELKTLLSNILSAVSSHVHPYDDAGTPNMTQVASNASTFDSLKSNSVDNEAILSDIAFTEKGS